MGDFIAFERFLWFDNQIRQNRFPNAVKLSAQFEVCTKTARRDIRYFNDRYHAPIEYNRSERGYYYLDPDYKLPSLYVTQDEIIAVLIAQKLLSSSQDGLISPGIARFNKCLLADASGSGFRTDCIEESFSADWNGHALVDPQIFHEAVLATINNRLLSFSYWSPGNNEQSQRVVEPHHLQYYMANWMLIAWCHFRKDWRKFSLSRMTSVAINNESFERKPYDTWQHLLDHAFGIFQGGATVDVTLRFNPFRAQWIQEQSWHSTQKITRLDDGSLDLTFPVSDFREVKMKILQFGADVKVIQPADLQNEIKEEIVRMTTVYGGIDPEH